MSDFTSNKKDFSSIDEGVSYLKNDQEKLTALAMDVMTADSGKFFSLDMMVLAAITRALSQNLGFVQLVESRNFLCAAPLVRLQLDIALRISAAWLVQNPHKFAEQVWDGEEVGKIKDKNGIRMTDAYLVDKLSLNFPWVPKVYKHSSGFVHLSQKHFYTFFENVRDDEEGRHATIRISPSPKIPDKLYIQLLNAFSAGTDILIWYLEGWIQTKGASTSDPPSEIK